VRQSIKNSWALVKASAAVLGQDKELLIFPILSAAGTVLVALSFFVPIVATDLHLFLASGTTEAKAVSAAVLFLFYLATYFVIFFCNSALVGAALIRLRGGDPTVRDGLRIASEHAGSILVYALISATVGLFLRWLSERLGFIGRIVVSLVGAAWSVATFLVVPILVTEKIAPVDAVRRSAALLKQTWGEQLVGNLGISLALGWLTFAILFLCGAGMVAVAALDVPVLILPILGVMFLWVMGVSLVGAALRGIYVAAVYRHAAEGQAGGLFDESLVRSAFRSK
jgi:hypothetical protein